MDSTTILLGAPCAAGETFGIALSDGLLPGRRDQAAPFRTVCCRRSVSRPRRARLAAAAGPCSAAPSDRLSGYHCVSCRADAAPMLRNRRAHGLIIAHRSDLFSTSRSLDGTTVRTRQRFHAALVLIIAWAVTGPFFHYSDTWQLRVRAGVATDGSEWLLWVEGLNRCRGNHSRQRSAAQ